MSPLAFQERPASGEPEGLLVLHHGRGADENDLIALADVLDPQRRLHVATPRAPLTLPGWPGYHWYVVPRVGYPDPDSWYAAFEKLASFHDTLWDSTGIAPEQTVLGGFSMGSVMSYSLGLDKNRPAPAGIRTRLAAFEQRPPRLHRRGGFLFGRRQAALSPSPPLPPKPVNM